ncbi:MAG: hypothetical protein IPG72_13105 [Ardenticatenales bacterium]|jgi:hypothetical protein|nr:hypothetical protein [Ardenticatenales bacterium]
MIRALLAAPPVLLGIAALVAAFPWPLADRLRRLAPVAAATAALGSALSLAALGLRGAPPVRLILSPWLDGDGPALESNALVAIALTVIGLLGLVAALRALAEEGTAAAPLAVCAAAALMASAGTERLGLVFGWIVLDATLAVVGGGRQGLLAGQAGLFMLLAGLTGTRRFYLEAASLVRAGMYPLWWSVPRSRPAALWQAIGIRLAPTVAGLAMALQVITPSRSEAGMSAATLGPGLVALTFGALLAFFARERGAALDWTVTAHAGLAMLAIGLVDPAGQAVAFILMVDLALIFGARYAAEGLGAGRAVRLVRFGAWASLVGLPPTLGFVGRWTVYHQLVERQAFGPLIWVMAMSALLVAPDHPNWLPSPRARRATTAAVAVPLVLVALSLGLGLAFRWLGPIVAASGGDVPDPMRLITARPSVLLLIVAGPAIGWLARRLQVRTGMRDRSQRTRRALRLREPINATGRVLVRSGELLQLRSGLVAGRRSLALTLLAVVATSVALVGGDAAGPAPAWPPVGQIALLALAIGISATVILPRAPALTLGGLGAAYVLGAVVVFGGDGGARGVIAAIKLIVGLIVVTMLSLSILQAPLDQQTDRRTERRIDRQIVSTARRLRQVTGTAGRMRSDRLVPALALAIVALVGLGMQPGVLAPYVGAGVLRIGIVLAGGGVIGTVFAGSALQLAASVLLALIGSEAIYASLDAGLLVSGGLAGLQLLFTIVASFFIGQSPLAGGAPNEPARGEAASVQPEVV